MKIWTSLVAAIVALVPQQPQNVEQTSQGPKPPAAIVASFDGMGVGFEGPQGKYEGRNPSDNSLAVGPNHIVQTVNSRLAIFSKQGKILYGPVQTNIVFAGFGGPCEARNNGDAVVRYDQLADRWLVTMPIFSRIPLTDVGERPPINEPAPPGHLAQPGQAASPGPAAAPPPNPPPPPPPPQRGQRGQPAAGQPATPPPPPPPGTYAMCYAISVGPDPLGAYYRYAFERPLFPDYPRPAVWTDGYYNPTSSSDNRISETIATQKHACVVDRASMLKGQPAAEQCQIVLNVNFLNNADIDGKSLPPDGAPNIMMAAGGTQLDKILESSSIDVWQFHVDWKNPANTKLTGPVKLAVAPYHYLCGGQLTNCVPQPETDRRLDAQGDKVMSRLVYRRIGGRESIVAVHSVDTSAGGGGVRWYEFQLDKTRRVTLRQQGTYAPDKFFRWMASPAIDKLGNIALGYSFGGAPNFAGQRFTGRLPKDPLGTMTLREAVLVEGEASQVNTLRWEDYTTTAIDPSDDCTIWYVGDYLKKDAASYSTRIGAFGMPGCR
ncbi:MAG TPA: hypothetical protein VL225_18510 [Vicinamibacterales bacterium]|jgi:hypothetical protein|nr:hypothetical protein [Vicinamibacterales bacterium]